MPGWIRHLCSWTFQCAADFVYGHTGLMGGFRVNGSGRGASGYPAAARPSSGVCIFVTCIKLHNLEAAASRDPRDSPDESAQAVL